MRRFRGVLSFIICILFFSATARSQSSATRSRMLILKRTIEQKHYSPTPVNDSFSVHLYERFIQRLNEDFTYLDIKELQNLTRFRTVLDDELNGNGWQFLDTITKVYKAALIKQKSTQPEVTSILERPSGYEQYIASLYGDVLANLFDPHTEYMPKEEKEEFESSLSTQGSFFGFALEENDSDQLEITRIMPGSPAWKTGELNAGDVIVSAGWEGKTPVDIKDGAEELYKMLSVPGDQKLVVKVRKANGVETTTSLSREKMENEENNVRAYVLKGTKNIGYIYLPDFYTAMGGTGGSSANDVAKAVVKLKKENIEGLILDVRYNGGGSLVEALDMAGIFIDAGPLAMIREKDGKVMSLKDQNRGTIYSGPMTLLVNGQSASASELLGAVLQDYNRAIIIGSRSFGKGSAQQIFPLDTTGTLLNEPEYGFVKVTTGKFYRVDGRTTQFSGVSPDISLPDIFDGLDYHEGALPSALPADTIARNMYYKPLPAIPINELVGKSKSRVASNTQFTAIAKYVAVMKTKSASDLKPLDPPPATKLYSVDINSFDAETVAGSAYYKEIDARWKNRISKDIYVEEAYNILSDLLTINPK
jgi:carboxyl-terminal processing protease